MAYKYLNDDGLKAYTKKVKGALKDLHTPIAISTLNTTESMAQNVRNIADFIAKAKAAGIADVNGMAVTCIIDNDYSAVLAFYGESDDNRNMFGVSVHDDTSEQFAIRVSNTGYYTRTPLVTPRNTNIVTSEMLTKGARKPIILTSETTEVDEGTYQKLFPNGIITDDVDIMFRIGEYDTGDFIPLVSASIHDGEGYNDLYFAGIFCGRTLQSTLIYGYRVRIDTGTPHQCEVTELLYKSLNAILSEAGYLDQSILTPVPLTATASTNKTQLDLFLSKVPNAQVMHVTYKNVYAGTLHKINGSWYGVLVGESNTLAGQLSIKLQADGTIVEGTA